MLSTSVRARLTTGLAPQLAPRLARFYSIQPCRPTVYKPVASSLLTSAVRPWAGTNGAMARLARLYANQPVAPQTGPTSASPGTVVSNKNILNDIQNNQNQNPNNNQNNKDGKLTTLQKLKKNLLFRILYYSTMFFGLAASALITLLGLFFLYDATTYKSEDVKDREISVSQSVLSPIRGGPKNLPICYSYLDSEQDEEHKKLHEKPKLVILGSGWGSVALLKELDPELYDITVISPTNYFLFTPMLPSATVGTLEFQSLMEPVRRICSKINAHYLEGAAEKVEFSEKLVEVRGRDITTGEFRNFYVPYDKLVVGVGATSNTHGVPGLEYCHTLKTVQDARMIRRKVVSNLETACLPTTSDEERRRLLSFVICGGGPTGVEMAAEIYDLLSEDLDKHYPKLLRNEVSVHVIQSRSHILNTYDEKVSDYAMERFHKDGIDLQVNSRVKEVFPDRVVFTQKDENEPHKTIEKELPFGLCIWSTGVAQTKFTRQLAKTLGPENQKNRHAIETDSHLRVIGAPMGDIYAIGDCSTVRTNLAMEISDMLRTTVLGERRYSLTGPQKITDEELKKVSITYGELSNLATAYKRKHPEAAEHFARIKDLFDEFDRDNSGTLSLDELTEMLKTIDKKVTSLPALAQRASQQGIYLGRKLNRLANAEGTLVMNDIVSGDVDDAVYKPFSYHHLGSLAYVSNAAVFDFGGRSYFGGIIAMYLWRGVYFAQSVSFRTRALLFFDWLKRGLFGRDLPDITSDEALKELEEQEP